MLFQWSKNKRGDVDKEKNNNIPQNQPPLHQTSNDVVIEGEEEDAFIDLDNMNGFKWIFHVLTMPPSDLLLYYNEKLELIDWDNKSKTLAQPLGHSLTLLTFLMRFLQDDLIKPNYMNIYDNYRLETMFDFTKSDTLRKYNLLPQEVDLNSSFNDIGSSDGKFYIKMKNYKTNTNWYYTTLKFLDYLFYSLLLCLLISNFIVSYRFLFGYYKYYSLFYTLKTSNETPDISKKSLDSLNEEDDETLSHSSLFTMIEHFIFKKKSKDEDDKSYAKSLNDKDYYFEVKKWIPSKFITNLFMTFSPMCLAFLFLSNVSFSTIFAIVIHQSIFQIILNNYHNRIVDENILFSATFEEYYMKVIKPIYSKKNQDVMIDATPQGHGFVEFYPSSSSKNNHIFTSHTLTGDTLREKYNTEKQEFEELGKEETGHNIIVREPTQLQQVYWDPALRQYITVNRIHANGTTPILNQVKLEAHPSTAPNIHHDILRNNDLNFKVMPPGAFSTGLSTPSVVSMPLNKTTLLHNSAVMGNNANRPNDENISQYGSALNNTHNINSHPHSDLSLKRGSISPLHQTVIYNNAESRTDPSPPSSKEGSP